MLSAALALTFALVGVGTIAAAASPIEPSATAHPNPHLGSPPNLYASAPGYLPRSATTGTTEARATRLSRGPAYSFLMMSPDRPAEPIRWNPCRVITWGWQGADARGNALMARAVDQVASATGIRFVHQPTGTPAIQVHFAQLTAPAIGYGGAVAVRRNGWYVYEHGSIVVESRRGTPSFTDGEWLELLTHELGHVMGLGHVDAPGEMMFTTMHGQTTFGPGDRAGLRRLGRSAGCIADKPLVRPSAPRGLRVMANSAGTVRLGWAEPVSLGNAASVRYRLRLDGPRAMGSWVPYRAQSIRIDRLRPGVRYRFVALATNDLFAGPAAMVEFTAKG